MAQARQIGDLLVDGGFIPRETLALALQKQTLEFSTVAIGEILSQQGAISRNERDAVLRLQDRLRGMQRSLVALFRHFGRSAQTRCTTRLRLGDLLVAEGKIDREELRLALHEQRISGESLGHILVAQGKITPRDLRSGLRLQKRLLAAACSAAMAIGAPQALAQTGNLGTQHEAAHALSAPVHVAYPELRDHRDAELQKSLDQKIQKLGLGRAVSSQNLAVALVDITNPLHPALASANGDQMMYAASLPKIGILLGAMQKIEDGEMTLDLRTQDNLTRMIRSSSNTAATAMYHAVGPAALAATLKDYGLYDPAHNGGLWVGKPYSKGDAWKRDPLHGISHGATPIQVARFLYLMETGQLASPTLSAEMKSMLGDPGIAHKFVKGLNEARPGSQIYRKSGTWRGFHSDAAIVERDGRRYIAVALAQSAQGGKWLTDLIVELDDAIHERSPTATNMLAANYSGGGAGYSLPR